MKMIEDTTKMPGPMVPAFLRFPANAASAFAAAIALAALVLPTTGMAQQSAGQPAQQSQGEVGPSIQPPPSMRPVPDALGMSKLVWSTILAVDHANQSGNYSVLRDMAAQGFQINNNAAKLAGVFAGIRNSRIDLSNALLVPPTYTEPPRQIRADLFEVKGAFKLRPTSIYFDMYFQWEQGRWKLFGIDIQPASMAGSMPTPPKTTAPVVKR